MIIIFIVMSEISFNFLRFMFITGLLYNRFVELPTEVLFHITFLIRPSKLNRYDAFNSLSNFCLIQYRCKKAHTYHSEQCIDTVLSWHGKRNSNSPPPPPPPPIKEKNPNVDNKGTLSAEQRYQHVSAPSLDRAYTTDTIETFGVLWPENRYPGQGIRWTSISGLGSPAWPLTWVIRDLFGGTFHVWY